MCLSRFPFWVKEAPHWLQWKGRSPGREGEGRELSTHIGGCTEATFPLCTSAIAHGYSPHHHHRTAPLKSEAVSFAQWAKPPIVIWGSFLEVINASWFSSKFFTSELLSFIKDELCWKFRSRVVVLQYLLVWFCTYFYYRSNPHEYSELIITIGP